MLYQKLRYGQTASTASQMPGGLPESCVKLGKDRPLLGHPVLSPELLHLLAQPPHPGHLPAQGSTRFDIS